MKKQNAFCRLQISAIVSDMFKFEKSVKYANKMNDDDIHSTQCLRNAFTFLSMGKILIVGQAVSNSKMRELIQSFHKPVCIVLNQLWLCPKTSQSKISNTRFW